MNLPPLPPFKKPIDCGKNTVMLFDGSLMYMPEECISDDPLAQSFYDGMMKMRENYVQALHLLHGVPYEPPADDREWRKVKGQIK